MSARQMSDREYLEQIALYNCMGENLKSEDWLRLAAKAERDGMIAIAQDFLLEAMVLEEQEATR